MSNSKIIRKVQLSATTCLTMAAMLMTSSAALAQEALPTGGSVASGSAMIGLPGVGSQTITQSSDRAVINWNTFNVGQNNSVVFVQPNADAATLNRVTGDTASSIAGQIQANGSVYLINPNGIQITQSGVINAGRGFVASTLDISNADFMAGKGTFTGNGSGLIDHQGSIAVGTGGAVGLLGGNVNSSGTIMAPAGKVVIGAVKTATLDLNGDGFLQVALPPQAAIAQDGSAALVSAQDAYAATRNMVNLDGAGATSVSGINGNIVLGGSINVDSSAGNAGSIMVMGDHSQVSGALSARATGSSGNGGFVETSGNHVNLNGISVDTRAAHGTTGTWLIDPTDFTIAPLGGDMTGASISAMLPLTDITIKSFDGASGTGGDVHINDDISWIAGTLTIQAARNINVNGVLDATGIAAFVGVTGDTDDDGNSDAAGAFNVSGKFNLASGTSFTLNGDAYTIINSLGSAGSATGTDLQGVNGTLSGNYVLGSDIDASATSGWNSGAGFAPIGNNSSNFTGKFDGLGHVISNLTINRSSTDYVGLFGATSTASIIRNLGQSDNNITGNSTVGSLVGQNRGAITRVYATGSGSVIGSSAVGGLVGDNFNGTINTVYSTVAVTGSGTDVGGLVGYNDGAISNAYATGNVTGNDFVGGLVGYHSGGTINQAYSSGSISGSLVKGGLVAAKASGTISNSYWNTDTSGLSTSDGGTGLTDAQMQQASNFTGWSIDTTGGQTTTWRMYEGNTAPLLKAFLKTATVTAGSQSLAYDGTTQTVTPTASLPGGIDLSKISGLLAVSGSGMNIGTYNYTLGGIFSNQQGYDLVASGALTITPAALTITGASTSGAYTSTVQTNSGFTTSGLIGTDSVAAVTGFGSGTNVGTYADALSGATGTGLSNYTISYVNGARTITPVALTVTGLTSSAAYAGVAQTNGFGTIGLLGGDTVTGVTGSGSGTNVGTYNDSLSGATGTGLSNYTISYVNGARTITPVALTITGDTSSVDYTSGVQTNGFGTTGLLGSDSVTGVSGSGTGTNVGTYNDNLSGATGTGLTNYTITYTNGSRTINRASLTITGATTTVTYNGAAQSNSGFTTSGLLGSDTVTGVTGFGSGTDVGTYSDFPTGVTGTGLSNYLIRYRIGSLTITAAPLTVTYTANAATSIYGNAPGALSGTVTASGLLGSDTLGGTAAWATTANGTSNIGSYGITGSGVTASSNYTLTETQAAGNATALTINPRALSVVYSATAASRAYGDANPAFTGSVASTGLVNGDTLGGTAAWATTANGTSNIGSYGITGSGVTASSNYTLTATQAAGNATALTISPRALTITADAQSRMTGIANPTLTYALGGRGLVNGDQLSGALATSANQDSGPGEYAITLGTLAATSNYAITYNGANLNVTAAPPLPPSYVVFVRDLDNNGIPYYLDNMPTATFIPEQWNQSQIIISDFLSGAVCDLIDCIEQ